MSILSQVTRGKLQVPLLALVNGVDGVGKSSLAADAPGAIFLGTETGTSYLNVARFPEPKTFKDVLDAIDALTNEESEFKTLAVDSLDWLEPLVFEQVCKDNNWKNIEDPGYGKGYIAAIKLWEAFIAKLRDLRAKRGMHILLLAHTTIKSFADPTNNSSYDRFILKLHEKSASKLREFVDFVFFMNFEVITATDDKTKKTKAFGDGKRILYTERRPAFDAKSRLPLPHEIIMPIERPFEHLMSIIAKVSADESPEAIKNSIIGLLSNLKDEELKAKVLASIEKSGGVADRLRRVRTQLQTVLA